MKEDWMRRTWRRRLIGWVAARLGGQVHIHGLPYGAPCAVTGTEDSA